jgi:CHAT domain-containing protein/tetratricopeptide (TPR) repeat protein
MLAMLASMEGGSGARAQAVEASSPATVAALIEAGHYAEAEEQAESLYRQAGSGPDSLPAAATLVAALVRNGRGAEPGTRELAESAVRARAAASPAQPQLLATALDVLAEVLFQAGDYLLAVSKFREALAVREKAGDTASPDLATNLEHLAQALTDVLVADAAAADEGLRLINRALAIRERSGTPAAIARARRIRGLAWQNSGDYVRARADLEEALRLQEVAHQTHPEVAATLVNLGEQLAFEGALRQAHAALERACTTAEATLRAGHPELATCLRSFAMVDEELGDLSAAKSRRERGLAITEASLGPNHPKLAVQLNDLANNFLLQGEFSTARTLYERARSIYEQRLGVNSNAATVVTFNLGLLYRHMGTYVDARRAFDRVIATWTRILGQQHPNVARALSAVAELLDTQNRHADARVFYTRALRIRERALGAEHPYVARTVSNLAWTVAQLRQPREALALSNRALHIWEQSGARGGLSEALVTHSQILSRTGDDAGAELAYRRALDIRLELFGPAHPLIAETEVAYSLVQAQLNERRDAFERALRGDEISRNHSRLTLGSLSERQALDYAASRPRGLDLALSLISSVEDQTRVLDALILGRSLTLDEIGARHRVPVGQDTALAPLWATLASTRQRFTNLVIRGPDDRRPGQYAALVDDARRAKEEAERQLAEQSVAFRSEQKKTEINLDQVRTALPADSGLVSIVRFNRAVFDQATVAATSSPSLAKSASRTIPSYVAFVLRPGTDDPTVVPLGRADALDGQIAQWRRELIASIMEPSATPSETDRSFRNRGASLRRKVWDPIAAHLEGVRRVFVVPDGAVNLVPLTALPVGGSRYLLEDGPVIHYLSAERDLVRTDGPVIDSGRGLLALGGPAFSDASVFASPSGTRPPAHAGGQNGKKVAAPTIASAAAAASGSFRGAGSKCPSFQSIQFPPLPGSGREVDDIANLWRARRPEDAGAESADQDQVLIGRAASEQALKELAPGRRILHLATHGFFLGDQCASALDDTRAVGGLVASGRPKPAAPRKTRPEPLPENPLVLSGLAMTGANRRAAAGPEEDDGILTAEEVASLNLQGTEWAVLSACGTGLGEIKAGEGVLGLRRAFQIAGARTVIMSLWPVDDRATRMWMRALYKGRLNKQLNTADAVREASLSVLRDRRARRLSTHPFYWAAFVAAGDWR